MSKSSSSPQTDLTDIWTVPTIKKILASGLEDISEEFEKELGFYALKICDRSVGL